jgi:hypothetical protein
MELVKIVMDQSYFNVAELIQEKQQAASGGKTKSSRSSRSSGSSRSSRSRSTSRLAPEG